MRTALMKIHINVFQNNLEIFMITHRQQVTDMIISAKVLKSIKWADVAKEIGLSKEWVTAACLGQMAFNKQQAEKIGQIFDLSDSDVC
jgi:cyanate lyase